MGHGLENKILSFRLQVQVLPGSPFLGKEMRYKALCVEPDLLNSHIPVLGAFGVHKNKQYFVERMGIGVLVKVYDVYTGELLVAGLSERRFRPVATGPRKPLEHWS